MVGVRVGRRVRVASGFWVGVALGDGVAVITELIPEVEVGSNASDVGLGPLVAEITSAVGEAGRLCVSCIATTTGEEVTCAASPAWSVRAMMVGM
jgi:hypothetical protein